MSGARRRCSSPCIPVMTSCSRVNVKAYLKSVGPREEALEQIATRLSLEEGVTAISWELATAVDAGADSITKSEGATIRNYNDHPQFADETTSNACRSK